LGIAIDNEPTLMPIDFIRLDCREAADDDREEDDDDDADDDDDDDNDDELTVVAEVLAVFLLPLLLLLLLLLTLPLPLPRLMPCGDACCSAVGNDRRECVEGRFRVSFANVV
jgi:hypothetical protein